MDAIIPLLNLNTITILSMVDRLAITVVVIGTIARALVSDRVGAESGGFAIDAIVPPLDLNTIIILALIAGLSIACLSIGALVWAFVADRLIRDNEARKTLIEWIKSKLRSGS